MSWHARLLSALNVVGGIAVLGSYVLELARHPGEGDRLWGGTPAALVPLYTAWMLVAAAGYLAFTWFWVFGMRSHEGWAFGRPSFAIVTLLYVAILAPSSLWMPLTFRWLASPSPALWIAIRALLLVVGSSSLAMVFAICAAEPRVPGRALAAAGAIAFTVQTLLLDALIWPVLFRR